MYSDLSDVRIKRQPHTLDENELRRLRGPQDQKALSAQYFYTGTIHKPVKRMVVIYQSGDYEIASTKKGLTPIQASARVELLKQKTSIRSGRRLRSIGRRCWCGLPHRLCRHPLDG